MPDSHRHMAAWLGEVKMVDERAFAIFHDSPVDDLAMLGFIHALQVLAEVVLDDEQKRERVWRALHVLMDEAVQSDLTELQLDYYLRAVHSVNVMQVKV